MNCLSDVLESTATFFKFFCVLHMKLFTSRHVLVVNTVCVYGGGGGGWGAYRIENK